MAANQSITNRKQAKSEKVEVAEQTFAIVHQLNDTFQHLFSCRGVKYRITNTNVTVIK